MASFLASQALQLMCNWRLRDPGVCQD